MAKSLPYEILQEIFKHFINDIIFLHSCLLVNKDWCNNAVIILWKRPFHLLIKSHKIISTYLSCFAYLDREERLQLEIPDYSIFGLPLNPPTYNYTSLLRNLSYLPFIFSIQEWCIAHNKLNHLTIIQALFRLFAKFSPSLKTLVFEMNMDTIANDLMLFNGDFSLYILREPIVRNWISHIEEIDLAGYFFIDTNFLYLLTICKDLKKVSYYKLYYVVVLKR